MAAEKSEITRKENVRRTVREMELEFFKSISGMLTAAFGLVAALAWNELVKSWIQVYIAPGSTVVSQFLYAVIVTIIAVLVAWQLGSIARRLTKKQVTKQEIKEALEEGGKNDEFKGAL